jgi:hypothetical protein
MTDTRVTMHLLPESNATRSEHVFYRLLYAKVAKVFKDRSF